MARGVEGGELFSPPIALLNAYVDFPSPLATHGKGVRGTTNPNVQVLLCSAHRSQCALVKGEGAVCLSSPHTEFGLRMDTGGRSPSGRLHLPAAWQARHLDVCLCLY